MAKWAVFGRWGVSWRPGVDHSAARPAELTLGSERRLGWAAGAPAEAKAQRSEDLMYDVDEQDRLIELTDIPRWHTGTPDPCIVADEPSARELLRCHPRATGKRDAAGSAEISPPGTTVIVRFPRPFAHLFAALGPTSPGLTRLPRAACPQRSR